MYMNMDKQHVLVHAAARFLCCMSMSLLHVHVHAACPRPCCISMSMLNLDTGTDTDMVIDMDIETVMNKDTDCDGLEWQQAGSWEFC
jgi:hypothetical protein